MEQHTSAVNRPSSGAESDSRVIVILGGSGHASDVMSVIESLGMDHEYRILVADDSPTKDRFVDRNTSIVSPIKDALLPGRRYISGVGYPKARKTLVEQASSAGLKPAAPLIHPTAVLATGALIEDGTVVGALAYVSALATIKKDCYVGYGAKVGHDASVGARTSLMPGAFVAGDATVGSDAIIGANATVLQGLTIGDEAVVGAGAVVTKHVPPGETVTGVPATLKKSRP